MQRHGLPSPFLDIVVLVRRVLLDLFETFQIRPKDVSSVGRAETPETIFEEHRRGGLLLEKRLRVAFGIRLCESLFGTECPECIVRLCNKTLTVGSAGIH